MKFNFKLKDVGKSSIFHMFFVKFSQTEKWQKIGASPLRQIISLGVLIRCACLRFVGPSKWTQGAFCRFSVAMAAV
jgi:hypothetical protein